MKKKLALCLLLIVPLIVLAHASEEKDAKKALEAQGFSPMNGSAEDFDAFYRSERAKWGKVITESGLDKD